MIMLVVVQVIKAARELGDDIREIVVYCELVDIESLQHITL
jgi:hypothetical protein